MPTLIPTPAASVLRTLEEVVSSVAAIPRIPAAASVALQVVSVRPTLRVLSAVPRSPHSVPPHLAVASSVRQPTQQPIPAVSAVALAPAPLPLHRVLLVAVLQAVVVAFSAATMRANLLSELAQQREPPAACLAAVTQRLLPPQVSAEVVSALPQALPWEATSVKPQAQLPHPSSPL